MIGVSSISSCTWFVWMNMEVSIKICVYSILVQDSFKGVWGCMHHNPTYGKMYRQGNSFVYGQPCLKSWWYNQKLWDTRSRFILYKKLNINTGNGWWPNNITNNRKEEVGGTEWGGGGVMDVNPPGWLPPFIPLGQVNQLGHLDHLHQKGRVNLNFGTMIFSRWWDW